MASDQSLVTSHLPLAMNPRAIDWIAIEAHPRFQELHRRKRRFLWGLMAFSVLYYFLLPIGAAYWVELFRKQIWGPVNVGLLFALSEFLVAWAVAFIYSRHASRHFDAIARRSAGRRTERPHDAYASQGFVYGARVVD